MEDKEKKDQLFELEVYGLVVGPYQRRPLLLMRDKEAKNILPVNLTELEAQILAFGSDRQDGPHGVSLSFLKSSGVAVTKSVFHEIRNTRQVLNIFFKPYREEKSTESVIECFAENSMSFAIGSKAPIYASQKFIDECRRTPFDLELMDPNQFNRDKIPPNLVQ